jgi:hypothetical protein
MNVPTEYIFALATIILIPIYYYYTKLHRIEKFFETFPTPTTVPILGNARDLRSSAGNKLKFYYQIVTNSLIFQHSLKIYMHM